MGTYVASLKILLGKTHWNKNLNNGKRVQHYARAGQKDRDRPKPEKPAQE
jgi:hypothetical protein